MTIRCRKRVWLGMMGVLAGFCGMAWSLPPKAPPAAASAPASQAAGVTLRGHVTVADTWMLQKPELSRVIVYLASSPALDSAPPATAPAIMAQRNKMFDPDFSVISIGSTVEFPNWDHFDHNVFSRSAAAPAFDLSRYSYGQSKSIKFEKVGVIQLFCNIHPSMRSLIFVAPNPYFARADAQGRFEIKHVPAGDYELVAWSERCKEARQKVHAFSGAADIALTLQEDRSAIMTNDPPKPRVDYGVGRGLFVKREHLNLPVVGGVHPAPGASAADSGH